MTPAGTSNELDVQNEREENNCVAPRHVDAPRDFLFFFFFSERAARAGGGGEGALPDFFFFFFPCSADHERDWPPCKVVFFGLATNALNVRNNNNTHT